LCGSIENRPARDRYRVVIIDEVHMLSVAAFNALLKTLEEPPRHVKFIFATTDPHKVPETIHSRCQHYDFRRLTAAEISSCLRDIADREGVTLGVGVPEALAAIAEGGMRDAQSRLDQLIAFRGTALEVRDIEQVFGLVSRQGMLKLVQSLRTRDPAALFSFVEDAFSSGKDLAALVAGLTRLFRDLMIIRAAGGKGPGLDLLPGEEQLLADESRLWPQEALLLAVDLLSACGLRLKSAEFPRFVLESSLLKLSDLGNLRPVDDLISALDAVLRQSGSDA
jgi:DNA polymerase-3 subunit gamma/tau